MELAKRFRPISYLKTNTADVAKELQEESGTVVITQNGVPSFVCLSFEEHYRARETNALIKLLSLSQKDKAEGKVSSLDDAMAHMEAAIFGEEEVELKAGT